PPGAAAHPGCRDRRMSADPEKLKRESAGRYVSADGRFAIDQSSGRWLTIDAETTDELGMPLVRGPFATLDEARAAITTARDAPPVTSILAAKIAAGSRSGRATPGPNAARTEAKGG